MPETATSSSPSVRSAEGSTNAPIYAIAARTDKGIKRSANEDAVALLPFLDADAAFVLADGMGGLSAGDIAAQDTTRVFSETLTARLGGDDAIRDSDAIESALRDAATAANTLVYERAEQRRAQMPQAQMDDYERQRSDGGSSSSGAKNALMGSTVVAGVAQNGFLTLLHVGDSRAYRLNAGGKLERLTLDHSFVEERVRAGDISEAEARKSRFRNMITRAVGISEAIVPEVQKIALSPGDRILVCSDGLNTMLEDAEIGEILRDARLARKGGADAICDALVEAANDAGGSDNVTVVLIAVPEADGANPLSTGAAAANVGGGIGPLLTNGAARGPAVSTAQVMPTGDEEDETTTSPNARTAAARRTQTTGTRGGGGGASIVDVDNPEGASRPKRQRGGGAGTSPFVVLLATLGGLAALGLIALALSGDLRRALVVALLPSSITSMTAGNAASSTTPAGGEKSGPTTGDGTGKPANSTDLSKVNYSTPVRFTDLGARGDLLLTAPRGGLYCVTVSTNNLVALTADGKPVRGKAIVRLPEPTRAQTTAPLYVATDTQGNLYVSQTARKVIEKRSRSGQILKTIGGFERPEAVAVDEKGNIYVVDFSLIKIISVKIAPPTSSAPKPAATTADTTPKKP